MAPTRPAFRREQVIPAVAPVQVWCFGESELRAFEDADSFAHQSAVPGRVLLQHDARKPVPSGAVIPQHVHEELATVLVVEQ